MLGLNNKLKSNVKIKQDKKELSPINLEEPNFDTSNFNSLKDQITEETKEFTSTKELDIMTLTEENPSDQGSSNTDEDDRVDENIEMERVMKMNFYKFKAKDHKGIVGMCQKVKRGKSPENQVKGLTGRNQNQKYKSFLNKSINSQSYHNLMLSNALLTSKKAPNKPQSS